MARAAVSAVDHAGARTFLDGVATPLPSTPIEIVERRLDLENPALSLNRYMIMDKLHKPMSVDLLTQSLGPMLALPMLWDHWEKTQIIEATCKMA